jgi:3-phenylpropionate/trans-cinnamate dioxygenase ferredoxin reductase subunit
LASLRTLAVVGASLAGLRAAQALRRLGYDGRLVLVGAEKERPYDRPPLSKEILRGEWDADRTALVKPEAWQALEIDERLGVRAVSLDLARRELALSNGERVGFDGLVIATGAAPRPLPNTPRLPGIHLLRTLDDALAIRAALEQGPRVAIVGAGFIGLEVAASCRARGLDVVVIEALPQVLVRSVGARMGELVACLHRDRGVDLRVGQGVSGFEGAGRVEAIRLADGKRVPADLVVVGIGVAPETRWLEGSGLALDDGVVCDASCAAAPRVVAAGDVARWENPLFGERMRVEHWTHAVEQGEHAAARLLAGDGAGEPFAPAPFFWSDQYDVKIQFAGRARPEDEIRFAHGTPEDGRFVALFGRGGRLVGALGFNRARRIMDYRKQIRAGVGFEDAVARAAAE